MSSIPCTFTLETFLCRLGLAIWMNAMKSTSLWLPGLFRFERNTDVFRNHVALLWTGSWIARMGVSHLKHFCSYQTWSSESRNHCRTLSTHAALKWSSFSLPFLEVTWRDTEKIRGGKIWERGASRGKYEKCLLCPAQISLRRHLDPYSGSHSLFLAELMGKYGIWII